jgi:hypothetical protein
MMKQPGWPWLAGDALRAAHHVPAGSTRLWTILAVVAALLGSAFVAWQSFETHRATSLNQRALDASNSLAIDSARSRLDQDAPRIEVYVEQVSVLTADPGNGPGPRGESGARWILPADAGRRLRVQAEVRVVNLMTDRTIHLKVSGLQDAAMRDDTEILLFPAAKLSYYLTATFSLGQWAENWESHQTGNPAPNIVAGSVIAGDDRDEGVVDTWPLHLAAWPIQPAGGPDGTWQLTVGATSNDWFQIAIRPLRERSYWISQRRKIALPEPPHYKPR